MFEIMNLQKAAVVQLTQDINIETSFNIGSSVMRALDFNVDIDDDDLFPPEDLRFAKSKSQRSATKLISHRSAIDSFEKTRRSNPGNFFQGDKLLQMQKPGRNNR